MSLIYGERYGDMDAGEPYIAEKGVFTSVEEFAEYRRKGWEGTADYNAKADALIAEQDAAKFHCPHTRA